MRLGFKISEQGYAKSREKIPFKNDVSSSCSFSFHMSMCTDSHKLFKPAAQTWLLTIGNKRLQKTVCEERSSCETLIVKVLWQCPFRKYIVMALCTMVSQWVWIVPCPRSFMLTPIKNEIIYSGMLNLCQDDGTLMIGQRKNKKNGLSCKLGFLIHFNLFLKILWKK